MKIRGRYIKNYSFNDYYFPIPNNYMKLKERFHGSLIVKSTRYLQKLHFYLNLFGAVLRLMAL